MRFVEYRVRPVTRYIITRFEDGGGGKCASTCLGEHDSEDTAFSVALALCSGEEAKGELGEVTFHYPTRR